MPTLLADMGEREGRVPPADEGRDGPRLELRLLREVGQDGVDDTDDHVDVAVLGARGFKAGPR